MNKTAKGILIGAGVLVLLSGALVALKLTEPDSGTASGSSLSSQEDHSTLLWELDEKDIKSVAVTFGTDSYTMRADRRLRRAGRGCRPRCCWRQRPSR